jgi:GrpB-like predicted nucleotidyltransferase (UPF0157 family)
MEENFSFNKDAFQIRAVKNGEEEDQYMVTLGDQLASPRRFNSYEEAQQAIDNRDWDMIACLAVSLSEHLIQQYLKKEEDK